MTSLTIQQPDGRPVALSWDAQSAKVRQSSAQASLRYKVIRGEVDRISFYSSAVAAGMTDRLIPDFAAAFAHDVDFQREIAPGDIFQAVYSTDEGTQDSRLLYASLTTRQRTITLYRYSQASGGKVGWFDGNGVSAARSLLRTPVDGARVSSSFGPRFHPVLRYTRLHRGVDFAVPIGTQVYASGDGVVQIAGGVRGYGNYLRIRHADGTETAYAHLSRFSTGVIPGATVRQGQLVALSGNSGLSSGPHLHYEVYIRGVATDPMQVTRTGFSSLPGGDLRSFRNERDRIDRLRTGMVSPASVSTATE
ncbi:MULTISPECIES: peptidoglycan DD-metalloendopeptidase family protein [unclassified Sphingobium]|uniref:peptidoglycan DD-metalloendopeptidase family protein n=1 Tax=unclassified Sphingobium TaxID=2611147 RepID=UPI0035A63A82